MPHLTPMSWITAIIMVWSLISIINIIQWSNKPMKFTKQTNSPKSKMMIHNWSW